MTGIYLLGIEGLSYIKVGISSDIDKRLGVFQTGLPVPVVLYAYEHTPYAAELEQQLHKRLAQYRVRGEWFEIPLDEALRLFNEFIMMARVDEFMTENEPDEESQELQRMRDEAKENALSELKRLAESGDLDALTAARILRNNGYGRQKARPIMKSYGFDGLDNDLWTRAGGDDA